MVLGRALPRAASCCGFASCLVLVAWSADRAGVLGVEVCSSGREVGVVVDLVGVADAARAANLTAIAVAAQDVTSEPLPLPGSGDTAAGGALT
jgi:hypothetical protein